MLSDFTSVFLLVCNYFLPHSSMLLIYVYSINLWTCGFTVAGYNNPSRHTPWDGPTQLFLESTGGRRPGPSHGPPGGRPNHLQLHQKDRNGKEINPNLMYTNFSVDTKTYVHCIPKFCSLVSLGIYCTYAWPKRQIKQGLVYNTFCLCDIIKIVFPFYPRMAFLTSLMGCWAVFINKIISNFCQKSLKTI